MENTRERQLPVRMPPHSDELLSSWISRHAAFYAVPPLVMLRHCLPEVPSMRSADRPKPLRASRDRVLRASRHEPAIPGPPAVVGEALSAALTRSG